MIIMKITIEEAPMPRLFIDRLTESIVIINVANVTTYGFGKSMLWVMVNGRLDGG